MSSPSCCDTRSRLIDATVAQVFAAFGDPDRLARWWGPEGFRSTIHEFAFVQGARWHLTLHGPDGSDYPNDYQIVRLEPGQRIELDHPSDEHHFVLSLEFRAQGDKTLVIWQQCFDSVEHYAPIADFLAQANEQVLARLQAEVKRLQSC